MIEIMKKNLERLAEIFSGSDAKELRSIMADNMIFILNPQGRALKKLIPLLREWYSYNRMRKKYAL